MAIRLPVVLAQHSRRVSSYTDCEESWITSLLFEERLDATLVSDLVSIQPDSTDFLCLAGLKGDFVLVTWDDSSVVLRELVRLGFDHFDIVPVDGSPKVSSPHRTQIIKKIYLMAFDRGVPVSVPIGRLKSLLESKATPVFQLQTSLKAASPTPSNVLPVLSDFAAKNPQGSSMAPTNGTIPVANGTSAINAHYAASSINPRGGSEPLTGAPLPTGIPHSSNFAYEDDDFPHIDNLVDELDRFDS
ncbi:MAG: hypothetical protein MUC43_09815 [Pirellula sp.]|jgi:hypothetical protein|nr:hypothetical protein [Pirellula sp.]